MAATRSPSNGGRLAERNHGWRATPPADRPGCDHGIGLLRSGAMDRLPEMNARLRRIFRSEETYGAGTAAEQARRYRLTELLPATVAQAKRNSAEVPRTG